MSGGSWDYSVFWNEAMKHIETEVSEQEFSMWFNRMGYSHAAESTIFVSVPSSFYRDQVKQRYLNLIEQTLHDLSGSQLTLEFEVKKVGGEVAAESGNGSGAKRPTGRSAAGSEGGVKVAEQKRVRRPHPTLREEYTFENFVVGHNNSFAANAAMAIAKNPGTGYNPCLIYGGVGLGKTHLVQSIGNSVYQEFDNLKIVYVTMESFTNDFIQSIREKKTQAFKTKYRYADVLLIDDIHFLQKKPETQEELFHTFNALYDSNKQMVFTCDRPVSEIRDLTDRLRSRFERGLNVDLQPPSFETRFAILKKKIERATIAIPEEVIELICNNVTTNVRDLEAALTKLIAYADLVDKDISLDVARNQLKDVFASPKQNNITMDVIQRTVADYFNMSSQELKGKKRTKVIAFPRQVAMFIAREMTEYSTTEVGLEFGGRDHTTVMHACQRIESRMRTDPTLEPTVQFLIRQIKEQGTKS
ncbi:MAG: chromosomal replication initiator protein DnaA [Spirochaetaceae bacterium]|nr:MAG: chromosomal replication initiator protein DnaA [Spirochaetaceae bacterium]